MIEIASPAVDHCFKMVFDGPEGDEVLLCFLNAMFHPDVSREDDLKNIRGGEVKFREVCRKKEYLEKSCGDVCCEAKEYSLTRTRNGENETKSFAFDLEIQLCYSRSYHQRANFHAAELFADSVEPSMDPLAAIPTTVITFVLNPRSSPMDRLMYMTKPQLCVSARDDSDLSRLLRDEDVTLVEDDVQSTQCIFFNLDRVERSFFSGTRFQQFLAFFAIERFCRRKSVDKNSKDRFVFLFNEDEFRFTDPIVLQLLEKMRLIVRDDIDIFASEAAEEVQVPESRS